MKRFLFAVAVALFFSVALSHSEPFETTPENGARVQTMPKKVRIVFDEAIEGAFSTFKVYAYTGEVTNAKLLAFAAQKRAANADDSARADVPTKLNGTTKTVEIALKPNLKPGVYVVLWRALGVDTHTVEAQIYFRFKP